MNNADIRINACLSGVDAMHFQSLLKQSNSSASDLLREALREYHDNHVSPKPNPQKLLRGFVASGDGPADLSFQYKYYLTEGLRHKLHELHDSAPEQGVQGRHDSD